MRSSNMDVDFHLQEVDAILSSFKFENSDTSPLTIEEVIDVANEMKKELKEMQEIATELQADVKLRKETLSKLEKERAAAKKDREKLMAEHASISKTIKKYKSDILEYTNKINKVNRQSHRTERDKDILQRQEKEVYCFKKLTGIRWNVDASDIKEGIITNSANAFVKTIELENSLPRKKQVEMIWNYVSEAAAESWDNLDAETKSLKS